MPFSTIKVQAEGERGSITLDRPEKLNPLGLETLRELAEAARWLDEQADVKVVTVSGSGRAFSAGADVSSFASAEQSSRPPREAADAGRVMAEAIESMQAITIASIHGHCVGGGVVLAAACDLRLAAHSTRFSIPEVDLGIPLAWGGIPRLVREIGPAMTKELVLSCRPFTAEEGRALGFINRVIADLELDRAVDELSSQLARKSSLTLTATKLAVNAASGEMASTAGSWSDADTLLGAFADPESRRVGQDYLERLRR
jgi:enoyl-CoA hydratase/carnithine racemase